MCRASVSTSTFKGFVAPISFRDPKIQPSCGCSHSPVGILGSCWGGKLQLLKRFSGSFSNYVTHAIILFYILGVSLIWCSLIDFLLHQNNKQFGTTRKVIHRQKSGIFQIFPCLLSSPQLVLFVLFKHSAQNPGVFVFVCTFVWEPECYKTQKKNRGELAQTLDFHPNQSGRGASNTNRHRHTHKMSCTLWSLFISSALHLSRGNCIAFSFLVLLIPPLQMSPCHFFSGRVEAAWQWKGIGITLLSRLHLDMTRPDYINSWHHSEIDTVDPTNSPLILSHTVLWRHRQYQGLWGFT